MHAAGLMARYQPVRVFVASQRGGTRNALRFGTHSCKRSSSTHVPDTELSKFTHCQQRVLVDPGLLTVKSRNKGVVTEEFSLSFHNALVILCLTQACIIRQVLILHVVTDV